MSKFEPMDWKVEIVQCGDLIQDDDDTALSGEAERRWNRYVELADSIVGNEGSGGVAAIVSSLKAVEDYGAYQAAYAALSRFPPRELGGGVALAGLNLCSIPEDNSGNVLLITVRAGCEAVQAFNRTVDLSQPEVRMKVRELVDFHESNEWLSGDGDRGILSRFP